MIAVEIDPAQVTDHLEICNAPAARWAVFTGEGPIPAGIVQAEICALSQWLPTSGYEHDPAPEMEVYLPGGLAEFWLSIRSP